MSERIRTRKQSAEFGEIGTTGLAQSTGFVHEEFLRTLSGRRGAKTFHEMRENDPIIGGVFYVIESLIRGTEWNVDPSGDTAQHVDVAEFVESAMSDMTVPWVEFVAEALSMLEYGWSYHEIVYKTRSGDSPGPGGYTSKHNDGRIGWAKLPVRAQPTLWKWRFDDRGEILGMEQYDPHNGSGSSVFIPITKALLFRTTSRKNNPEGRSILRSAYRPWYFKKNIEEFEAIGIERELAGLPVMWVPPRMMRKDASAEDRATFEMFKHVVRRVKANEMTGLVLPLAYDDRGNKRFDFELASTNGRRLIDTDAVIRRYDQRIAMTVLADFILLGHEKVGSFALSSDKTSLFSSALSAFLEIIAAQFNDFAIPQLVKLNGWSQDLAPRLRVGDLEKIEIDKVAQLISSAAGAGAPLFPDVDLENWLRRLIGAPLRPEETT